MKNLLTSLKKLGKKMTGSDVTGTNLVTVVDDIANKYTGGGGGGGGGDNIEQVTFTPVDETTFRSDKTAGEIINSYLSGKVVFGFITTETGGGVFKNIALLHAVMYSQGTNTGYVGFLGVQPQDNNCALTLIGIDINGDLDVNLFNIRTIMFSGN